MLKAVEVLLLQCLFKVSCLKQVQPRQLVCCRHLAGRSNGPHTRGEELALREVCKSALQKCTARITESCRVAMGSPSDMWLAQNPMPMVRLHLQD